MTSCQTSRAEHDAGSRVWRESGGDGARVLVAEELAPRLTELGLDRPWELLEGSSGPAAPGRGPHTVVQVSGGPDLLLKRCLRGGIARHLNRGRYFAIGRFRRELDVGLNAAREGLPVAETLVVVLRAARPGWHAWAAARLIQGASDLTRLLPSISREEEREALLARAAQAIRRLHDAGLEHRDLNLGNMVARRGEGEGWRVWIVDLDRVRRHREGLSLARRRGAVERIERSWRKIFGPEGPVPATKRSRLLAGILTEPD